jgi:hypothetical protein
MPECDRCGDFTDNPAEGEYHYCDDCLNRFAEIESNGVIVEQDSEGGDYHIIVTARESSMEGGSEHSQIDALARGKYIADETDLPALFRYKRSGSRWELDEYLKAHPDIRQDVHERLRRVPGNTNDGWLSKIRDFL